MAASVAVSAEASASALTTLSEDEKIFAAAVRDFARAEIGPHVLEMDESAKILPDITRQCFELGLMGIEIPEEYDGSGGSFFMACLAIEELARVDPSLCPFVLVAGHHRGQFQSRVRS